MDLSSISRSKGEMKVKHPVSGADLGSIFLVSVNSSAFKKAAFEAYSEAIKKGTPTAAEEMIASDPTAIVAMTIAGWDEKFATTIKEAYTPDAARKLCADHEKVDWLLEQINAHVADEANFFRTDAEAPGSPSEVGRKLPVTRKKRKVATSN